MATKNKDDIVYYYDNIYHIRWEEGQVKSCPHPFMIEHYGSGGECIVCLYTCKKCKLRKEFAMHGAVGCSLLQKEEKNVI